MNPRALSSNRPLRPAPLAVTLFFPVLLFPASSPAGDLNLAFLLPSPEPAPPGSEAQGALALAGKMAQVAVLFPAREGGWTDAAGRPAALSGFPVLWWHEGDSSELPASFKEDNVLESLRQHVAAGGGLLLSGAALALVEALQVEPVHPRRGGPGRDGIAASLIPVEEKHPVFRGLSHHGSAVAVSDAGYPAFADFYGSGGPKGGMLLACTAAGSENPLVEYELGKGRIIAMGWRLPHYGHARNIYRANLERLTRNLLSYLAAPEDWQKVVPGNAGKGRPEFAAGSSTPGVPESDWRSLELAVRDLIETFQERYPRGAEFLGRIEALKRSHAALLDASGRPGKEKIEELKLLAAAFNALRGEALLANPLLGFDRLLLVKRGAGNLGLPQNWEGNSSLGTTGFDNEIAGLSPPRPGGRLSTLYRPEGGRFAGDLDLHFDGDRLLFSMPGVNGRWQVHELRADGSGLRELPLIQAPDIDNYDACYLPDGRIIFCSTAPFTGVPCVRGASHVANLYILEPSGAIRQLTVDQEHNWCPAVLNSGRILYQRWEYTDTPHAFYRLLFHMNPDGTEQREYYGSNSYWPNAMFYARPIPGEPSKVVAVVGGHHDYPRMGELVLFDPALGRYEASGAVQRIPGYGQKVEPILLDGLTQNSWPKFLHPYPLSSKHFLVSCKPSPDALWGLYLADLFDNLVLLREEPGYALLEPVAVQKTPRPPVIPDKVDLSRKDALVLLQDVYLGDGLKGVPRGTVKSLRLISYHFAYYGMGGQIDRVGLDGPWDVKRVLGTVPVHEDGSACFRVPAYTPIAVQPLDAEGKAVQLMRSWFTAMPGETVTCTGCHEKQNTAPPAQPSLAASRPPAEIQPWRGPPRGFSFEREVQPALDRHCIGCHDGRPRPGQPEIPDFTRRPPVHLQAASPDYNGGALFPPSYLELRKFVRSPTIESDLHLLPPREFHADTTRLAQLLQKGHYSVRLDAEAWDRLITWIDLHTPAHGTWTEICGEARVKSWNERRRALRRLYTGVEEDPEEIYTALSKSGEPAPAPPPALATTAGEPAGDTKASSSRGQNSVQPAVLSITLAQGLVMELAYIPAGELLMGANASVGSADERPAARVKIEHPFWMGRYEVTNEQFQLFDPEHDSHLEGGDFLQFYENERGYPLNGSAQPAVRVSWLEAMAFCRWLSCMTGRRFTLPTEAQWEYACRAGAATPFWYGTLETDFSSYANLSDRTHQSVDTFSWGLPSGAIPPWRPADARFDDRSRVSAPAGSYRPSPWGLHDMHGNAAEWTRSSYRPYPYDENDGRNQSMPAGRKVVRGGSWYDHPKYCTAAARLAYDASQVIYNVGFRVICEADEAP